MRGTRVQRDALLTRIDGVVAGENPRHGYTDGGMFYHPDLAFQFPVPSGLPGGQPGDPVVLVEKEQQAAVYFGIEEDAGSAREAAEALRTIRRSDGRPERPGKRLRAHGAFRGGRGPVGRWWNVRLRAHYVDYNGRVYSFLGLAAQARYAGFEPVFIRTMQGFAPLRDPSILQVEPTRIRVVQAASQASFRSMIPAALPTGFTESGLAILNQIDLSASVPAGRKLKLLASPNPTPREDQDGLSAKDGLPAEVDVHLHPDVAVLLDLLRHAHFHTNRAADRDGPQKPAGDADGHAARARGSPAPGPSR